MHHGKQEKELGWETNNGKLSPDKRRQPYAGLSVIHHTLPIVKPRAWPAWHAWGLGHTPTTSPPRGSSQQLHDRFLINNLTELRCVVWSGTL